MCRLLMIKATNPKNKIDSNHYLKLFSKMAKTSIEYQGDGWGVAWREENDWKLYKSENPIWEETFEQINNTDFLLAHVRSAFNNSGSDVESTMPFKKENKLFIFNGEIRGVKIRSTGKSGAEKLFNFILRLDNGNLYNSLQRTSKILEKQSNYIRANNFIIIDKNQAYIHNYFNENPDYFTIFKKQDKNVLTVCSEQLDSSPKWEKIQNKTIEVFKC
ncbi:MAG: Gamma-glutamyl-hercynylcysteine sulfoxide hydrolase [Candidatus Heimdallarchaeota archaeon LC_3]|nr:MAG: Gamma-glutamyl-hercynylcysteine sulfoxide hydrolase [Candidatus Heimdallarchaeota archaeon LC_3]